MKIFIFTISTLLLLNQAAFSQNAMVDDNIAVFYPSEFDSSATLPSLALVKELQPEGEIPDNWNIRPDFVRIDGKNSAYLPIPANTDLYGTGEVIGPLRRNGQSITLWNTDNYAYSKFDGKQLYQSHPWVMGVRPDGSAFGIIADHSYKQDIILEDSIKFISEGPAFRVIVIEKANPAEILKSLADLTGKMELPPLWALGHQQSRYTYYPDTTVKNIADEFRAREIPCDVIWMDIDYMDGYRIFTFDEKGFPDPEELNAYLHAKDFKAVYMIDPGAKVDTAYWVYQEGSAGDHWVLNENGEEYHGEVWPGQCAFPDYTRPETHKWWSSLYNVFIPLGIDGVWNDMNEPAVFDGPAISMPTSNIHRGGGELPAGEHLRYHNVYGLLMVRSTREAIERLKPDKRPFVLSRANFLGGHRYAATWTGDNKSTMEHLKLSVPMSLTLGLSGQPFNGPDIGGFVGDANAELFGHWIAIGAYYPFSRNHAAKGTRDQEPWSFGEEIEEVSRTAISRRYRLLPHFYTLFEESSRTGLPVMRPTFFADFTDLSLREEEQSFLLGDELMIVPRWANEVQMPGGNWDTLRFEERPDEFQATMLLRDGGIVPVGKVIQSTTFYRGDSLTFYVNPDPQWLAEGEFYYDAGDGYGYEKGEFARYIITAEEEENNHFNVTVNKREGDLDRKLTYRIGYLKEDEIIYSTWTSEKSLKLKK